MRILTRTQYDAICDIVTDLQKENAKLKVKMAEKEETIDYLNNKLFARTKEVSRLRQKLNEHGLTWTVTGVDFPATTKQPENKYY